MEMPQEGTGRRRDWQDVLAAVVLFSFVFRVYILINPQQEPVYQMIYSLLYVAMTACTLRCAAFRNDVGCKLMTLCTLWILLSCAVHTFDERETYQLSAYLMSVLFAFFVCYPMAIVQAPDKARRALDAVSTVYLLLIFGLSLTGLYATLTGTVVPSLAGPGFIPAIYESDRLTLFCYPTAAGTLCCLALLNGLYLVAQAKFKWCKALCILAMLVIYAAFSLTDSRTSGAFFAACLGAFFYLVSDSRLPVRRALPRFFASCCIALLIACLSFFGMRLSAKGILSIAAAPSAEVAAFMEAADESAAPAAEAADSDVPASEVPTEAPSAPSALAAQPDGENLPVSDAADGTAVLLPEANDPGVSDAANSEPSGSPEEESGGVRALFENLSTLQGRTYAWEGAIRALQSKPALLLLGSSPLRVMDEVSPYITQLFGGVSFAHLHSIFFQTLVAYGLPGLMLFGAITAYLLYHALRLFFLGRDTCTIAERSLCLLLFFCLAVDLLETFLSFSDATKHSNPLFFLAAGYVVRLSSTRIPAKTKKKAAG